MFIYTMAVVGCMTLWCCQSQCARTQHSTTNNYTFDSCKPFSIVNYLRWRFCSCFLCGTLWLNEWVRGRRESSIDLKYAWCIIHTRIYMYIHFNGNACERYVHTNRLRKMKKMNECRRYEFTSLAHSLSLKLQ